MWFMQPVIVSINVPQGPAQVFDYLDVMANHARFNDHFMKDWSFDGPETGLGARARATVVAGGHRDPVEFEVIDAEPERRITERNTSAGGKRIGTYRLTPAAEGTHVTFEYAWQQPLLSDRIAAPFIRAVMRRSLQKSMQRLAEALPAAG
jgi:uncharacterized protein YndB with AHSA1/START domain